MSTIKIAEHNYLLGVEHVFAPIVFLSHLVGAKAAW